jgi:hypothetical protein
MTPSQGLQDAEFTLDCKLSTTGRLHWVGAGAVFQGTVATETRDIRADSDGSRHHFSARGPCLLATESANTVASMLRMEATALLESLSEGIMKATDRSR